MLLPILSVGTGVLGFVIGYAVLRVSPRIRSLESRSKQFQTFCEAIRKAARIMDLQEILDSSARTIKKVIGVKGCTIKLFDQISGELKIKSIVGLEKEKTEKAMQITESMVDGGLTNGEPIIIPDVHMREFPAVDEEAEPLMCVPLRLEDRILGSICVFGERGQKFSEHMISFLASLADIVSLSISHATDYENLQHLVQTKTAFMFQTSHELRSPLSAIRSMVQTILHGYIGEITEKQREMITRIDIRCQILSDTVNDLLSLAKGRVQRSTLRFSRVNLNRLIFDTIQFFEAQAGEKRIVVDTSHFSEDVSDVSMDGNEEGLRSVFVNLLANSIKYTPDKGTIELKLSEYSDRIRFTISDSGIGIPDSEKSRIFEEFYRASNAKVISETGTGLGLSIVRSIVEQHNGTIEIMSEEGKGTKFLITFHKTRSLKLTTPSQ